MRIPPFGWYLKCLVIQEMFGKRRTYEDGFSGMKMAQMSFGTGEIPVEPLLSASTLGVIRQHLKQS